MATRNRKRGKDAAKSERQMTQMIENSERGITLPKSLAWVILVGFLTGGVWIGTQVTDAKAGIKALSDRQVEDRGAIKSNTEEINNLRSSTARIDQRLTGIEDISARTEASVSEILRYLRGNTFGRSNGAE